MADNAKPVQETDGQWVLLFDPAWRGETEDEKPPVEAVVGGWRVDADGNSGTFEPNPQYEPASPDSPTDPVDATLRLVVGGDGDVGALLATLREAVLGVAVDDEGAAIVASAPDGAASVLVVTAPAHSRRLTVPGFREVSARELADSLPADGADVLLNPGAPSSMRLLADSFRDAVVGPEPVPADFERELR